MHARSLSLPAGTLGHLTPAEVEAVPELTWLARLTAGGWRWRGVAIPAGLEEQFYRLNNLPAQLASEFQGLDPSDPDEDIVEEAEEAAFALISQHYLLDETVDAIYEALEALPSGVVVRRAGSATGRRVSHRRAALLAVKHLFQDDWGVDAVMDRLALTGSLAIDARPVLITPADDSYDADASERAGAELGTGVTVFVDDAGNVTRLHPA